MQLPESFQRKEPGSLMVPGTLWKSRVKRDRTPWPGGERSVAIPGVGVRCRSRVLS